MESNNGGNVLLRRLKPLHVWVLAFGCIISWGAFMNPGIKFLPSAGVYGTGIAMMLGALIMIVISRSYSIMTTRYPLAGGEFTFTKICLGKKSAYWCGWFLSASYLAIVPLNATALSLAVHGLFGPLLRSGLHYSVAGLNVYAGEMLFEIAALVLFGLLSIKNVRFIDRVQTILAGCLAISVIILAVSASFSPIATAENLSPLWGFDKVPGTEAGYIPHEGGLKIAEGVSAGYSSVGA